MSIAYTSRSAKAGLALPLLRRAPSALAAEVDFLVVITPGGAATRKLIDAKVLAALGKKGYLVNVARGSVVDEQALVEALQNGTIAGAGLDVFENEPNVPAELLALDNVVLTPHVGSATWQTRQCDGRPGVRQPRGALRRQAAAVAGAAMSEPAPSISRGTTALVTGAGSGLGFAIARGLAEAGARVVLNGRDRRQARGRRDALRGDGLPAETAAFDVADPDAVARRRRATAGALRRRRHPRQQRRHPAPRADRRVQRRRLAPRDGDQPRRAVLHGARRHPGDEGAARRQDHQHRLADVDGWRGRRRCRTRSARAASRC